MTTRLDWQQMIRRLLTITILLKQQSTTSSFILARLCAGGSHARHRPTHTVCLRAVEESHVSPPESSSTAALSELACPFSMKFRPYRIDLSPRRKKTTKSPNLFLTKLLPRSFLEQRIQQSLKLSDSTTVLEWHPEQIDGIAALAILFKTAADLIEDETNDSKRKERLLAFPDTAPQVMQHGVEILQWSFSVDNNPSAADDDSVPPLTVEYHDDQGIPVVHVMKIEPTLKSSVSSTTPTTYNHTAITQHTQSWVKRILVQQGICPFTRSVQRSGQGLKDLGVPTASIVYITCHAQTGIRLVADALTCIHRDMLIPGPTQTSSILMAAPAYDEQFEYWAGPFFAILQACIIAADATSQLGVVCFHPQYRTPDGSTWPGFGHMHSVPRLLQWIPERSAYDVAAGGAWQRRTPHATLNVLWAFQLEAAEARRDSPKLYRTNVEKLVDGIGLERLQADLDRERNL